MTADARAATIDASAPVSIIIPCYRQAHWLGEAIDSALAQTYAPVQIVVVNDGSDDATDEVAKRYGGRITYVCQANRGLPAARNAGLAVATGDYVLFLDADDALHAESIERLMAAMQGRTDRMCAMGHRYFTVDLSDAGDEQVVDARMTLMPDIFFPHVLPVHTILCSKSLVEQARGFAEDLRACEDWDLWIRLALAGADFQSIDFAGAYYRRHASSMTRNPVRMWSATAEVLRRTQARIWSDASLCRRYALDFIDALETHLNGLAGEGAGARIIADLERCLDEAQTSILRAGGRSLRRSAWSEPICSSRAQLRTRQWADLRLLRGRIHVRRLAIQRAFASFRGALRLGLPPMAAARWIATLPAYVAAHGLIGAGSRVVRLARPDAGAAASTPRQPAFARCGVVSLDWLWARARAGGSFYRMRRAYRRRRCEEAAPARSPRITVEPPGPFISVVMPVYNPPLDFFAAAVESIRSQSYPRWQLCIADDASTDPRVRAAIERLAALEPRIACVFRETNGHIAAASNSALALAAGEYIALVDQDDLLPTDALERVALALARDPRIDVLYTDEDKIDVRGRRYGPYFKPDFNPSLMLGHNLISHLGVYRTELVRLVGGFAQGLDGSQDYDLALRCLEQTTIDRVHHIHEVLYHWRAVRGSAASAANAKPYALDAARRAIAGHLERRGLTGDVEPGLFRGSHRVRYRHRRAPTVSLVAVDVDQLGADCDWLSPILAAAETMVHEVLPATCAPSVDLHRGARSVVREAVAGPTPIEAADRAARLADGEIICFLSAAVQTVQTGWLRELVAQLAQAEVAICGGRLIGPRGIVRHAGYSIDRDGAAFDPFYGLPADFPGLAGHAQLVRDCAAVSGRIMVIRRDDFQALGGFNGSSGDAGADVDLCLRAWEGGRRVVWTPYASGMLRAAKQIGGAFPLCGAHAEVSEAFRARWRAARIGERFLNANLDLGQGSFRLAERPKRAGSSAIAAAVWQSHALAPESAP